MRYSKPAAPATGSVAASRVRMYCVRFDSSALTDRTESLTPVFEIFTHTVAEAWQAYLVPGKNVLAFQVLNFTNGSTPDTDSRSPPDTPSRRRHRRHRCSMRSMEL